MAIPLAASLQSLGVTTAPSSQPLRIAVIGASAFGGWTALHLRRAGADVTLIDAWGPGNPRASSGGESRVIRAIYGPDRLYVEMVKRAYDLWLELDPSVYFETGALWLHRGDDAYVQSSLPVLRELGFIVDKFTVGEASRLYPQFNYEGVKSIWFERRAGALAARRACVAVRNAFEKAGGTYRTGSATPGAVTNEAMKSIRMDDSSVLEFDAFVFACGPWLGKLFPDVLGDAIRPTKQEVFYFGTPGGTLHYLPGRFPVWIDFGERIYYGIPDVEGRGFKIADDTRGEVFDPTNGERTPNPPSITRARALLKERFPELADAPLLRSEVCQYENSPDGDLLIDRHPHAKNVWLAGGGSGHGFKLSPAVGELVASAILTGREIPKALRLERLHDVKKGTQFERK